jgi:hypothetical protein
MDFFIERIITRKRNSKDYLIYSLLIIGASLVLCATLLISALLSVLPLIAAGVIYLGYIIYTSRNIEFEYTLTNSDLDIDKITAKRKRKQIFSANCASFELVAKYPSDIYNQLSKDVKCYIEAVSSMNSPDIYFILSNCKNGRTIVFFEPNEEMLITIRRYIPKKVHTL